MAEHGGNLDTAMQRFGGRAQDWIDLSTGINRQPYPVGEVPAECWNALPPRSEIESLHRAAGRTYGTQASILATNGAQAAIGLLPHLSSRGHARILAPTYSEYAAVLSAAGWDIAETSGLDGLEGADLAVVGNPNNPDGQRHDTEQLLALLPRVGRLVVDESFADAVPHLSLASLKLPSLLQWLARGRFRALRSRSAGAPFRTAIGRRRPRGVLRAIAS